MSATAPLSTDLKFYFSSPTGGSDDNRKFNTGGSLATPLVEMTSGVNYNWFPDVSRVVITFVKDGAYWNQYACCIIKNTSTQFKMSAATVSVSYNLVSPDNIVGIGVSPKNAVPTSIANINTAPTAITFKEKSGSVLPTVTLSDMASGEFYAVWIRVRGIHGSPLFKFARVRLRVDWTNIVLPPPPPPPTEWVHFQDSTGPLLSPARIVTIFPGGSWDTATNPSMDDINNKIKALCNGSYFGQLNQYRTIVKPTIDTSGDTVWDDNQDLHSTFTDSDMRTVINNLIDDNTVDSPNEDSEILYLCFPDHNAHRSDGALSGHSAYSHSGNVHYGWSDTGDGIDPCMIRVSKQLINTISNPEPNGTIGTPGIESKDGTHKGLADWCTGSGTSSSVKVNQYYSEANAACVVP